MWENLSLSDKEQYLIRSQLQTLKMFRDRNAITSEQGLSQILCKHRNAVQIEQNLFKAEVAQAAAALFSK